MTSEAGLGLGRGEQSTEFQEALSLSALQVLTLCSVGRPCSEQVQPRCYPFKRSR